MKDYKSEATKNGMKPPSRERILALKIYLFYNFTTYTNYFVANNNKLVIRFKFAVLFLRNWQCINFCKNTLLTLPDFLSYNCHRFIFIEKSCIYRGKSIGGFLNILTETFALRCNSISVILLILTWCCLPQTNS